MLKSVESGQKTVSDPPKLDVLGAMMLLSTNKKKTRINTVSELCCVQWKYSWCIRNGRLRLVPTGSRWRWSLFYTRCVGGIHYDTKAAVQKNRLVSNWINESISISALISASQPAFSSQAATLVCGSIPGERQKYVENHYPKFWYFKY